MQVRIPVMEYMDCKPHYQWLTLEKRTGKDRPTSGELHLRVQLRSDDQYLRLLGACNVQVSLQGIGLNLVQAQASSLRPPCELIHCLLEDINLDFRRTDQEESVRLAIQTLQVDNQLLSSQQPVILSPHVEWHRDGANGGAVPMEDNGLDNITGRRPVFEVTCVRSLAHPSALYLQYFTILLQEMNLVLEEELLDHVIFWARNLPLEDIWQLQKRPIEDLLPSLDLGLTVRNYSSMDLHAPDRLALSRMRGDLLGLGGPTAARLSGLATQSHATTGRKWYFEVLHIQPLKINLTVVPSGGVMHNEVSARFRAVSQLGIKLVTITNVSLRVNQLALKNAFVRPQALVNQIMRHMVFNVLSELYKILGSVELLGAPVSLISTLGTGVVDFFYEPAKGIVHGPDEFARGVATGTISLLKNSAYGIFHTVGQVPRSLLCSLASNTAASVPPVCMLGH